MIEYIPCGDYFIPDLKLKETLPIGKYGRMRKRFLKEHRPILYNKLTLSESLFPHLLEIEAAANRRIDEILPALMKDAGVTENLKAAAKIAPFAPCARRNCATLPDDCTTS